MELAPNVEMLVRIAGTDNAKAAKEGEEALTQAKEAMEAANKFIPI